MKLLIFSPYYPPHIGGLESHADEFNKYLSQKGVNIFVFTPRLPKDAPESEIKHDNVKIIRFPAFEIISGYPLPRFWNFHFWKLFFGLFKENVDIVISRTRFFATSIMALKYAKLKRKKWMHIEHGSDFVKLSNKFYSTTAKFYDYTLGKIILNFCDKLVANSNASAEFCQKLAPNKPCEVIYRGVEIEKIENAHPNLELKNRYKDKFVITFLGRLISGKGVSDLISAVENINFDFVLFIIGDGPERKNLEALAKKLNLENRVVFFGYQKFKDAIAIIKISDLVVNPSYTEGLPTSVIEVALCQKAIIATNVGGTPEIITNNKSGFLIEPKNPHLLREKINLLIENKNLRQKFSENAYEEVKHKFNWPENILKYYEIFENIVKYGREKIYFLSSRHGGPFKQHIIIAEELRKKGFQVEHRSDFWGWIKAHFIYGKNKYIITNVPLIFRFSKNNFILNIHGNYKKERSLLKNPLGYLYGLNKLWSKNIVIPSNYLKEKLNLNNAIVISNALPEEIIELGAKTRRIINDKTVNLIMVTMFGFREKAEGVLNVIKSLSGIRTEKEVVLNIFGKGHFENEIKKRAKDITMPDNIKVSFKGYSNDIYNEYVKSDIFVYWSDLDNMPIVFLEAMAFGLPIIANDFSSFYEILGESNFIAKSKEDFVGIINNLLNNPEKIKEIGNRNKEDILKYKIDFIMGQWLKLLN